MNGASFSLTVKSQMGASFLFVVQCKRVRHTRHKRNHQNNMHVLRVRLVSRLVYYPNGYA
jgi:hypothetical protein